MKIAFISQPLDVVTPSPGSSLGIWSYEVARRLAQSCEVTVYTTGSWKQAPIISKEGVLYRFITLGTDKVLLALLQFLPESLNIQRPKFASNLYYLGYGLQVALDLSRQNFDVIHIHNNSQFVPLIRAFNPKAQIVLHMHCEWLTQLDPDMISQRLEKVDLVIGCSEYVTNKHRQAFPQFPGRFHTIYNGADINHFIGREEGDRKQEGDRKKLLFVGRISPEKGIHILLDAFEQVLKVYPQAQLEVVGPPSIALKHQLVSLSDEAEVLDLARFYNGKSYLAQLQERLSPSTASQVCFRGFVPQQDIFKYFQDADLVINPSFVESFGMSLVQAMATETPVISTRVGGMPEVMEAGRTGLLVERNNVSELAQAIIALLADPDLRQFMGKAGRQRVIQMFSWETITENLLHQYEQLCFQHHGRKILETISP
ncbi:MAG: glycosyltransferase family 4 protein [Leptolyngbyaceae bacterium]|nr:glycosyltransferase family 4 protein [Leptolyngbyaceae bacterium]